jgi:hypothetical protein
MIILPDEYSMFDDFTVERDGLYYGGPFPYCVHEGLAISIYKWRKQRAMLEAGRFLYDGGTLTCGLCFLFDKDGCLGCPIRETTGVEGCMDTPYGRCYHAVRNREIGLALKEVDAELSLLEDLWSKLPEEDHEGLDNG